MPKILWIVFCIITLDMIGIGMIIPIIAPMILDQHSVFFSADVSHEWKLFWQGVALSLYPLFQFFGAPLLGVAADKKGRKPMLLLTLTGTAIGYLLSVASLWLGIFWIFLFARALDGFTGGNVSIANAVIADISTPEEKAKHFGMIGAAFGLGIVLGPVIGGILSDSSIVSWFSYEIPFLFAFIFSSANIYLVWKYLPETLKQTKESKFSLFLGFEHIFRAFSHPSFQKLFIVLFLYTSGFAFFHTFFNAFTVEKFGFTPSDIGILFAFLGVCIIFAQTIFLRFILQFFNLTFWIRTSLFGLAILLFLIPFVSNAMLFYPIFFCMALCNGVLFSNFTALISNKAPAEEQGEIMGIKESLNALGNGIPAILSSIIGIFHMSAPMFIASILIILSLFIFWRIK